MIELECLSKEGLSGVFKWRDGLSGDGLNQRWFKREMFKLCMI